MIASKDTISIYIHWPFCLSKCPYCDFNSHVYKQIDHQAFLYAYIAELENYRHYLSNKKVQSIFFGGGTPTLALPSTFASVLEHLSTMCEISGDCEITLEGNPTSIESSKFVDFKAAGINRISIGVQSFDEQELKFLGREHSASEAIKAIELADKLFDNYSFDLIYALPNQSIAQWEKRLTDALKLAKYHISAYQLTIEKGTKFFIDYRKGEFAIPDDNLATDLYLITEDIMCAHSFDSYEVSNYAKSGFECKHNLNYWRYGDFLGLGAGAHGRITIDDKKYATMNIHNPSAYIEAIKEKGSPLQSKLELTDDEIRKERLIMNLRINEGISYDYDSNKIMELISHGLLEKRGNITIPTNKGRLVINSIASYLLAS